MHRRFPFLYLTVIALTATLSGLAVPVVGSPTATGTHGTGTDKLAGAELLWASDSVRKNKPSVLTIRAFAEEISKPLPSAVAVITSRTTNKTERVALPNGRLERNFTTADELLIEVSAAGYTSVKRTMTIALSPQGNRYEFDAELDQIGIRLTVWAVDRQTDKIIPNARFIIGSKTSDVASITLTPDAATGQSSVNLPSKGIYQISSSANGYSDFVKSIRLDSLQNEARFILVSKKLPASTPAPASPVPASSTRPSPAKAEPVTPVAPSPVPVPKIPLDLVEKGKPVVLNNLYFDQSSPVLREQSYPELDRLYALLVENPSVQVEIRGHTDNQGDFDLNVKLSRERSQAVVDYLIGKGIPKSRLKAVGRGPIDPVAPNNNEENRRKNRRVELVVL